MQLFMLHLILVYSVMVMHLTRCESTNENLPKSDRKRGCNDVSLLTERGVITFYDTLGHPPNLHCLWNITVDPGKIIRLYVTYYSDESCPPNSDSCDSLTISDGKTRKELATFPNRNRSRSNDETETTSNMASIVYMTSSRVDDKYGFSINYFSARKELKLTCGVPIQQPNFSNTELTPLSVSPRSFPWHVNIFSETKKETKHCSGTIISRDAVLTAAHCFDQRDAGTVYKVTTGKHQVEQSEVIYDVSEIVLHPNYNKLTLDNDIAIVKVSQSIAYNNATRPICRAEVRDKPASDAVCVTSEGWTDQSGRFDLKLSKLTIQPITSCNIPSESKRNNSVCARFNAASVDVCNQRTPGGAVVCQVGKQWIQYGVMSSGIGCAGPNAYGVFTNIGKYNDWISTKTSSDCGRPSVVPKIFSRIVGGSESNPNSWPWQVSIQKDDSHHCGGSIISTRWILTAAHCFTTESLNLPALFTVVVGEHNLKVKTGRERVYSVEMIFRNPEQTYMYEFLEFDITLMYLAEDIVFDRYVKPVCLARYDFPVGQRCVVTGWGKTQKIDPLADSSMLVISDVLNELEVPLIDNAICDKAVNQTNRLDSLSVSSDLLICAGYLDGSKDSCFGDSGGPLVCFNDTDGAWKQIGIVSFGRGCAVKNFPGFYSKISVYYDWIKLQMTLYPQGPANVGEAYAKHFVDGR